LVFKQTPLKISSSNLIARRFTEWIETEALLQKPFQKTRVFVFSEKFTLAPDVLYSNNLKEEFAHVLFDKGEKLNFAENHVRQLEAKLLFALPEGLVEIILDTLGEGEIVHPLKPLLAYLMESERKNNLLLLFNGKDLYVIQQSKNQVKLANSFKINHVNDVVYFILTTLKQLGISSKSTVLFYAGNSNFIGETEKNLQNYFASIKKLTASGTQLPEEIVNENISLFI